MRFFPTTDLLVGLSSFLVGLVLFQVSDSRAGGPEQDELMGAILKSDATQVEALLKGTVKKEKLNLNEISKAGEMKGWNPLCLASALGSAPVVQLLLEHGALVSRGIDYDGKEYTPLMFAAQSYRTDPPPSDPPQAPQPQVIPLLLAQFSSSDYQQEIQKAFNFKQLNLAEHLEAVHNNVNWENADGSKAEVQVFLEKLNQREAGSGCTYDLPTDHQLWYTIRADVTGLNEDPYSKGVTAANVDQYVTHHGNSDPGRTGRKTIQPVGNKTPNAFEVELGNAWRMSKERYDEAHPNYGRSIRGGSWSSEVQYAMSDFFYAADAGIRVEYMGFSLVRTCR